jgi:hypothetical protein
VPVSHRDSLRRSALQRLPIKSRVSIILVGDNGIRLGSRVVRKKRDRAIIRRPRECGDPSLCVRNLPYRASGWIENFDLLV